MAIPTRVTSSSRKDGTINFLDFGIVGIIYPERRFYFIHLFVAMMRHGSRIDDQGP